MGGIHNTRKPADYLASPRGRPIPRGLRVSLLGGCGVCRKVSLLQLLLGIFHLLLFHIIDSLEQVSDGVHQLLGLWEKDGRLMTCCIHMFIYNYIIIVKLNYWNYVCEWSFMVTVGHRLKLCYVKTFIASI